MELNISVKRRTKVLIYEKITTSVHFTHDCLHYTDSNPEYFINNTRTYTSLDCPISKLPEAQAILQSRHHTVKNQRITITYQSRKLNQRCIFSNNS